MGIVKPLVIGDLVAKVPLIQGGMGVGVSLSSLAGAVGGGGRDRRDLDGADRVQGAGF